MTLLFIAFPILLAIATIVAAVSKLGFSQANLLFGHAVAWIATAVAFVFIQAPSSFYVCLALPFAILLAYEHFALVIFVALATILVFWLYRGIQNNSERRGFKFCFAANVFVTFGGYHAAAASAQIANPEMLSCL